MKFTIATITLLTILFAFEGKPKMKIIQNDEVKTQKTYVA